MTRLIMVKILGEAYPLNYSVRAARKIAEAEAIKASEQKTASDEASEVAVSKKLEQDVWTLSVLLDEGAAYKELFDGEKIRRFTGEELETILSPGETFALGEKIREAVKAGLAREIEVAPEKNAKPAPAKKRA